MPRGDKTGPMGEGAMTGRGQGFCVGTDSPGFMNQSFGRGFGGGFGGGRGVGRGFQGGGRNRYRNFARNFNPPVPTEELNKSFQQEELNNLKEQAQSLKGTLKNIELQVSRIQQEIENKNKISKDSEE